MREKYGTLATVFILMIGIILSFTVSGLSADPDTMQKIILLMFLAGIVGGFLAPYSLKSNLKQSVGITVLIIGSLVAYLYISSGQSIINETTGQAPVIVLGISILVVLTFIVTLTLTSAFILGLGGVIGSNFAKNIFGVKAHSNKESTHQASIFERYE